MVKDSFKIVGIGLTSILLIAALGWILRPVNAMVDRAVMVNSHQYIEGMEQRAIVFKSSIIELDGMIAMNPDNVEELRAKRRALNMQLQATIK